MADGVYLDVFANSKQATKSIGQVGDALDDVGDDLDELARDGKKATDKLERSFKDLASEAQRTSKKVGDDFEKNTTQGFHKGSEAVGEFKQEALANFSEVTSSFDGSMSSIQDLAQGTLGGLASSGLPGVSAAAGAAAIAVGLIGSAFGNNAAEIEKQKAAAAQWAQAFVEAGSKVLTTAQTTEAALAIITDPDKFAEAKKNAADWGVALSTAVAAISGQQWALNAVNESLTDQQDTLDASVPIINAYTQADIRHNNAIASKQDRLDRANQSYRKLTGSMAEGAKQADTYSRLLVDVAKHTEGATTKTDEFGDAVTSLPDGTTIYIDAETGQATTNVDAIAKKIFGLPKSAAVKVTADTAPFTRSMQKLADGSYRVKITVDGVTRYGQVIR